jgi:hypothetical protein
MTLLTSDLQRLAIVGIAAASEGGAAAGVIGTRQSRMIGGSGSFSFLVAVLESEYLR